ncbi:MAG: glycosyltransferase family 2 protein [Bacteroidia bacterium]|nr:glycosyltransferase family 2 protein [Bacteroidia bacterium]
MKIAIVILNWNGKALLERFLPSVVANSNEADIYLADNASTDDSVAYVKNAFPEVKIIVNKENGGYAKGYNDALKHVDADLFCLLNNDVEVTENWLDPIINQFNQDQNTAIVQPKLLDLNQKDHFEYAGAAGGFIDKFGYPYCRGRIFNAIEKDEGQYNDTCSIFWASGACLFIRSDFFKELKGFDEAFFAHFEEIDLCWRIKNLGKEVTYVGASTIYHLGGGTLKNTNPKKTYLNFRNSLFALTKNSSGMLLPKILLRLLLDGVAGIQFILLMKPQHTVAIIKAHLNYYYHLSRMLEKRDQPSKIEKYWQTKSIVWSHFVNRKKKFNRL